MATGYTQQTTANLVGNIAPTPNVTISDPYANSLQSFGSTVNQLGMIEGQSNVANKTLETQNAYENSVTNAAKVISDSQLQWMQYLTESQNKQTGNAAGFATQMVSEFDDYANKTISQYSGDPVSQKLLSHEFSQMRTQVGTQALSFQQKMNINNKINNVNDTIKNNSKILLTAPDQYAKYKAMTTAVIKNSGLDEIAQQKLLDDAYKTYKNATASGLAQNNPERLLNMTKPALGQVVPGSQDDVIAQLSGDNALYNLAVVNLESSGKANAESKTSTAYGLSQMTEATRKQYGLTKESGVEEQVAALNKFTSDNKNQLTGNLGREPTLQELYLAHHFGASGATKLIKADGNEPVSNILSKSAIKANPELKGKSVAEVLKTNTNMFNSSAQNYVNQQIAKANANPVIADMSAEELVQWSATAENEIATKAQIQRVNLKQTIDDQIAMAMNGNTNFTPLTEVDFKAMYPKDEKMAQEAYSNYSGMVQLGKDVSLLNTMSPEQEMSLYNSYNPSSQSGYADSIKRQQQLAEAINAKHKALNDDPASWSIKNSANVRSAIQSGDMNATYTAMIAEQQRQGVIQPKIITKDEAAQDVQRLSMAQGMERANVLNGLVGKYGQYWALAAAQLQQDKNLPEGMGAMITAPNEAARQRAAFLSGVTINQLKEVVPADKKISDIDLSVDNELEDFKNSLPLTAVGSKSVNDVITNVRKAAYDNARTMGVSEAARNAVSQFINDKYNFIETKGGLTTRIPKKYDAGLIKKNLSNSLDTLTVDSVDTEKAKLYTSPWTLKPSIDGYLGQIKDTGYWVTNNNEDGASLFFVGENNISYPVYDKSGKQITKSFINGGK